MDEPQVSSPPVHRGHRVEVSRDGAVVAAAGVVAGDDGTARVALQPPHEVPAAVRSDLVDAVLDSDDVRSSDAVHVVLPLGDAASIGRLQERTTGFHAHAAGASAVVDADLPHDRP